MALFFLESDNQYIEQDTAAFDGTAAFSMSVEFNTTTTGQNRCMIFVGRSDVGDEYTAIRIDTNGSVHSQIRTAEPKNFSASCGSGLNDGNWHTAVLKQTIIRHRFKAR